MIVYRKAKIDDVYALAKTRSFLLQEIDKYSDNERLKVEDANILYFEKALADNSFVAWIALEKKRIIATSGLCFYEVPPSYKCPDGKVAYVMNMFTLPEYRKKGIAMELLDKIVDEAKSRGYKKITLNATDMGKPLYYKYGFRDVEGDMCLCAN